MEILGLIVLLIGLVIFMQNNSRRDWDKNFTLDDLHAFRKKSEIEKKAESKRVKFLTKKYNSDIAIKIIKGKLEVGMSSNMVIDMKGEPDHKTQSVSKNAAREEWFYGTYKNRLKNISYKFRVVLVNEKVTGWNDINN